MVFFADFSGKTIHPSQVSPGLLDPPGPPRLVVVGLHLDGDGDRDRILNHVDYIYRATRYMYYMCYMYYIYYRYRFQILDTDIYIYIYI